MGSNPTLEEVVDEGVEALEGDPFSDPDPPLSFCSADNFDFFDLRVEVVY